MKLKLASIVLFATLLVSSYCSNGRSKRVVGGLPLNGRPSNYKAIRYYGALATAHWEPFFTFWLWSWIKDWEYFGWVSCGGSLITPAIFQTACHCVATMDAPARGDVFKTPTLMDFWEDRKYVYAGLSNRFGSDSFAISYYILTDKFVMHYKCGVLTDKAYYTHDYGLVLLDDKWLKSDIRKPYPFVEIETAPQYTSDEIEAFYDLAQKLELVCLHIGFGLTDSSGRKTDVLLHGWAALLQYRQCFRLARVIDLDDEDILKYYTWVCVDEFPKHLQFTGPGDSGGPVTCGGKYYAIASQEINMYHSDGTKETIRIHHSDLKNNLFVNSINWRQNLLNSIYRLQETYVDVTRPPSKTKFRNKFQDVGSLLMASEGYRLRSGLFLVALLVGHRAKLMTDLSIQ